MYHIYYILKKYSEKLRCYKLYTRYIHILCVFYSLLYKTFCKTQFVRITNSSQKFQKTTQKLKKTPKNTEQSKIAIFYHLLSNIEKRMQKQALSPRRTKTSNSKLLNAFFANHQANSNKSSN